MREVNLFGNIITDVEGPEALSPQELDFFGRMIEKTYFWDENHQKPRYRSEATITGTKEVNGRRWIWYTMDWKDSKNHQYLWPVDEYSETRNAFDLNGVSYRIGDRILHGRYSTHVEITDIQYKPVTDKTTALTKMLPIRHDDIGIEWDIDRMEGLRHLTAKESSSHQYR